MKKIQNIIIEIDGMTCASCVARVEKAISKAKGVHKVNVNLASEKATLSIDDEVFDLIEVKNFIENAGYQVKNISYDKINSFPFKSQNLDKVKEFKEEFIISFILTLPILLLNMLLMFESVFTFSISFQNYTNRILFILTLILIITSGRKFYFNFLKNLKSLSFDMNSLIAIGTGSAFLFSTMVTFFPELLPKNFENHVYYDTTAVIISLVLLGKWLEAKAKFKTNEAINELIKIQPQKATVKVGENEIEKNINELNVNEIVIIKPGQYIPTDGIVIKGQSTVDESIISGESIPVEKSIGSLVKSGSVNKTGFIEYRVTSTAANSTLSQIIRLMEESQSYKAPIQKITDKIASIFVPVVISIATLSFFGWILISNSFEVALVNFISVMIIACPCALGLAIPTAIVVGIGTAAKNGILIRDGSSLELFDKIKTIFFDKTGTITNKKLKIDSFKLFNKKIEEVLEYLIPAEKKSEHPIAQAIIEFSKKYDFDEKNLEHFESKTGFGIEAVVDGHPVIAGNKNFITQKIKNDLKISSADNSEFYVVIDNNLEAIFSISEEIKPEAKDVIDQFSKQGVKTILISGDKENATRKIAEYCNFSAYEYGLTPMEKFDIIKKFQDKNEIVAFVGDGINDAPSINQADVGIAMGTGTDIAILSGDVVLLNNNLKNILNFKEISKKVNSVIKQNLFWAFIYNVIGIPLAAFGMLNPIFAAFAMSLSSVSVISNSLRIKRVKR
ncbi:MAG: cation-translocating P-type ATPase [Ignavibacterium sp.]|nr:cation-translocating P-type ATPase [Ignavibacterium sp.]MCX7610793.1 cation-translocating P-type ATPase [Ignavibacterium sp.]MDW8374619.1 cation-translocating P-type ATPase [Ignavibacteriales bacterium]